jgi:hypothetical protein
LQGLREGKIAVVSGEHGIPNGPPPYSEKGHYVVLTGIEQIKKDGVDIEEFVHYNNPGRRWQPHGKVRVGYFYQYGNKAGCLLSK